MAKKKATSYFEKTFGKKPNEPIIKPKKIKKAKPKARKPPVVKESEEVRLNKYIANAGVCSRREADKLISEGLIKVNDEVIKEMGFKVKGDDVVTYQGKVLKKQRFKYLLLNKPKDYITTVSDTHDRKTVMELIENACPERVYPVGRLDRNTTGLLLFTNDGDLAKKLTHPSFGIQKTYVAELDKSIYPEQLEQLTSGIELEDGKSKFDSAEYLTNGNHKIIKVTLHSGKNRIVRRMFESLGYDVRKLDRIEFAGIKKGSLNRSKWRFLDKKEIGFLKMLVSK